MATRLLLSLKLQYIGSQHCTMNSGNHWCYGAREKSFPDLEDRLKVG